MGDLSTSDVFSYSSLVWQKKYFWYLGEILFVTPPLLHGPLISLHFSENVLKHTGIYKTPYKTMTLDALVLIWHFKYLDLFINLNKILLMSISLQFEQS